MKYESAEACHAEIRGQPARAMEWVSAEGACGRAGKPARFLAASSNGLESARTAAARARS